MIEAQKEKLFSKDYIMLVLFSTVIMVYVQMYLPVMAIYAKLVTGSNFMAGLSPGIFTCASLVAIRFSVSFIRKYGKAGTMAIGSVVMGVSAILYFFSRNLYVFLIARVIHGFGNGMCTPANSAAMADVLPKSRLMEGIGYFSMLQTITGAAAPAVALGLVENNPAGFNTVFILAIILSALCFMLSFTVTYEKKGLYGAGKAAVQDNSAAPADRPAGAETAPKPADLKLFLGIETILLLPMLMQFTSGVAQASIGSYLTLSTQERGISSIAYFYTIQAGGVLISRFFAGRLADRRGVGIVLIPSFLGIALSMYVVSVAKDARTLYWIAAPLGLANGSAQPALSGLFFKICSPGRNSETSAAMNATGMACALVTSVVVGAISSAYGYKDIYRGSFILPLVALACYFLHVMQLKRRAEQHPEQRKAV